VFFGRTNTNFNSALVRYDTDPKPEARIISLNYHHFSWVLSFPEGFGG